MITFQLRNEALVMRNKFAFMKKKVVIVRNRNYKKVTNVSCICDKQIRNYFKQIWNFSEKKKGFHGKLIYGDNLGLFVSCI